MSLVALLALGSAGAAAPPAAPQGLSPDDQRQIEGELAQLAGQLDRLRKASPAIAPDLVADAEVFHKGVVWALRFEEPLTAVDVALIKKALARGRERAAALASGDWTWHERGIL